MSAELEINWPNLRVRRRLILARVGIAFALGACGLLAVAPAAAQQAGKKVRMALVAEASVVEAAKPFTVGLRLDHAPGVHTYWINPGTGRPTTVEWELPDGWSAGPLVWALPHATKGPAGYDHFHSGTVYHLTTLTPPPAFAAGAEVTLRATVTCLQCDAAGCTPASESLSLGIRAGPATVLEPAVKEAFDRVRAQQPASHPSWKVTSTESPDQLVVVLEGSEGINPEPKEVYFFDRNAAVKNELPEVARGDHRKWTLTMAKDPDAAERRADGFLYSANGWLADGSLVALAVPPVAGGAIAPPAVRPSAPKRGGPRSAAPPGSADIPTETLRALDEIIPSEGPKHVSLEGGATKPLTYGWAMILAFVGGFLLNAMPCVFPVLGIKVLGFVNQAGENPRKVRRHGLVFALGLLLSLWVLAGLLIALNVAGQRLGWGFQQQSPGFTMFIIALLFVLGLNLAGVFEMGTSLTGVGGEMTGREGYAGSFFTGVLTTLIATPCSGPFLGAAMGYTLQQPPAPAFLLFTVFGLGIALPYLVLSAFPALVNRLPRPGPWMETFKVLMALPMFATVIYFLHSFSGQTGAGGVIDALVALLLLGSAAWIYGRWCTPVRSKNQRAAGAFGAVAVAGLAVWQAVAAARQSSELTAYENQIAALNAQVTQLVASGGRLPETPKESDPSAETAFVWEKWSPERVRDLRNEGRVIFADFTARWCATCQFNEKRVFAAPGSDAVAAKFKAVNAVALKADWTNFDPIIAEFLKRNGIVTIPAYFVYPADRSRPPILLPDGLISQSDVVKAIERAAGAGRWSTSGLSQAATGPR